MNEPTHELYTENNLNIQVLALLVGNIHTNMIALFSGLLVPWIPFVINLFQRIPTIKINPFYDPIEVKNIYNSTIVNPYSIWTAVFGLKEKTIIEIPFPLIL
jgi:hypothetical protein